MVCCTIDLTIFSPATSIMTVCASTAVSLTIKPQLDVTAMINAIKATKIVYLRISQVSPYDLFLHTSVLYPIPVQSASYSILRILSNGKNTNRTCPLIWLRVRVPTLEDRLSRLLSRLSPMTKYSSGPSTFSAILA